MRRRSSCNASNFVRICSEMRRSFSRLAYSSRRVMQDLVCSSLARCATASSRSSACCRPMVCACCCRQFSSACVDPNCAEASRKRVASAGAAAGGERERGRELLALFVLLALMPSRRPATLGAKASSLAAAFAAFRQAPMQASKTASAPFRCASAKLSRQSRPSTRRRYTSPGSPLHGAIANSLCKAHALRPPTKRPPKWMRTGARSSFGPPSKPSSHSTQPSATEAAAI
mmetsp:Transcript_68130/g.197481  ORF Transcript_68130/g.197481 Transcript_68130/m.197481 type:complete len:230 (-) Transcript_68130:68-757(-)